MIIRFKKNVNRQIRARRTLFLRTISSYKSLN